jgi:hypothetical protein
MKKLKNFKKILEKIIFVYVNFSYLKRKFRFWKTLLINIIINNIVSKFYPNLKIFNNII